MAAIDSFERTRKVATLDDEPSWPFGDARVTVITFGILSIMLIVLAVIGQEAITTERVFFRRMAMRTNQQIADLLGRQFSQVFASATDLVDDMAHFPSVINRDHESVSYLAELILKRHKVYRAIYLLPPRDGEPLASSSEEGEGLSWAWYNTNVDEFRPPPETMLSELRRGWVPARLSSYYSVQGDPAITFACAVRDRHTDEIVAILAAEIDLAFIQYVIDGAELGRTRDILIVDQRGSVVFSSRGFTDVQDFNRLFPLERAYETRKGGVEYFGTVPKLASYTAVQDLAMRPFMPGMPLVYPTVHRPRAVPDWLVVVLQDAVDGTIVADRLKWNIVILLIVGVIGAFIIGRLWLDSMS